MSKINLYPQFDNNININISFSRDYYFYHNGAKKIILEKHLDDYDESNYYELEDETGELDLNKDKIYLNITVRLDRVFSLFGLYAYHNAILGLGIEWKSKKSKIRNCEYLGEFSINDDKLEFKKDNIILTELSSDTNFEWVIFIKRSDEKIQESSLGNKEGLIIGRDRIMTIVSDGNASIFPIIEIRKQTEPLWSIYYNCSEPLEELFMADNIAVVFNLSHKDYRLIDFKSEEFDETFFKEVLSTALFIMLNMVLKGHEIKEIRKEHYENGSIAQALLYFEKAYNFNYNSDIELLNSIKSYFDNINLKE